MATVEIMVAASAELSYPELPVEYTNGTIVSLTVAGSVNSYVRLYYGESSQTGTAKIEDWEESSFTFATPIPMKPGLAVCMGDDVEATITLVCEADAV